jgi:heparosan-N-sulfate-glucuronate 5-epimerase
MSLLDRLRYYRRLIPAYLVPGGSHLTFWHEIPEINLRSKIGELGEYYMTFADKADYRGDYDSAGIPQLNYHGQIGRQYNPIAVAQWGLGNYNLFCLDGSQHRKEKFLAAADWLSSRIEKNCFGVWVWNHYFDWEYRTPLRAPWYSALAQGQGISLLVRAYHETRDASWLRAAQRAFTAFLTPVAEGGVTFSDHEGNLWFEEYIVSPPTHILNGFMWAAWGVYDYFLAARDAGAGRLFEQATQTLCANLHRYDLGFWSLYEQSGTLLPMVASLFYHRLHIVQLKIMHRLTGEGVFARFADKWENYTRSRSKRARALCCKGVFKLCYY